MPVRDLPRRAPAILTATLAVVLLPHVVDAQSSGQQPPTITLPTVVVTAQKEPAGVKSIPGSVTAVTEATLASVGVRIVSDAAFFAPNTFFTEFTARKGSNPRFRGIGASPANPAVTTYLDGVPQLNANSSSIELLDVSQVEFVRGPQSPLYGRNALGGIVNISSARPSLSEWTGTVVAPFANAASREVRGSVSGPLSETLAMSFSLGKQEREGYTTNSLTGNDLDFRSGTFGKAQLMWVPKQNWEARVIFSAERDRDGDYALGDLDQLRAAPFRVARDYEGYTHRDIKATTVMLRGEGEHIAFTSSTGFVSWQTEDATDLDYSPLPLATRNNAEESVQFTQEIRAASPVNAPLQLSDSLALKWQAGVMLFTQGYDQLAVNTIAPFVFSPFVDVPIQQYSPEAALDDFGMGVFGQATLILDDRLDLTFGARFDHEDKEAVLGNYLVPALVPGSQVNSERSYTNTSPQIALAYRPQPDLMVYGSLSQGFKAGGWNPASPPGAEGYDKETAWHAEGGVKGTLAEGRVSASAAVFHVSWNDMQLNVPNPFVPGQFYIANVGEARSRGVEFELAAKPHPQVELFGNFGYTHARFGNGSVSSGADVSGNTLPNAPDYTAALGARVERPLTDAVTLFGRAEAVFYGEMQFDDANTASQEAYSLVNVRGGFRSRYVFAEAWVRNAFDTRYVPVAFPYPGFTASGFIGEMGRPRTFGVSAGVTF
ncbi:MAG: TonB-dependent receptor [Acidobacteria bacterium]|nr:TonB-dependent receptor [Acidobacteriota bacterium]